MVVVMGFLVRDGCQIGKRADAKSSNAMYILIFSGTFSPRWVKKQATFAHLGKTSETFSPRLAKRNEDQNTFEEFLEPKEYIDHGHLFTTNRIFNSKDELVNWAKQTAMKANTYLIINRYQKSRTSDRQLYVTLACERGGVVRKNTKPIVDDEEEEVPIKRWRPYKTKKFGCLFKLKGEQMLFTSYKTYEGAVATD
ncbi:hypothetical protein M9H77_01781 [Catharanthus roseus]|uniref:Uncharacterized protein n=1 Tax=Catharanthus roseus TaxID=4058 RepID=A0ACC0C6I9_CATRO|nr:hypothetical protein M9H77_01781 [Catharanthus roseus]